MSSWRHLTPFMKQCFVTTGVALNIGGGATVMAFVTGMLPQLKDSTSGIYVDDAIGSWIAATPSMCLLIGNLITPTLMSIFGRKITNIISITIVIIGWLCLAIAEDITLILFARILQGVSMGMALNLGPILIAEYTSPVNRGAFLMFMSVLTATGVLVTHTIGSYFSWQLNATVCMVLAFLNLLIVLYSPESPAWLADNGRYDDCSKTFRWLRGEHEEIELNEIIKSSIVHNEAKIRPSAEEPSFSFGFVMCYIKRNMICREFYMPIFIMIHVYGIGQWAGINVLSTYTLDVCRNIISFDGDVAPHIIALDTQRIVSNLAAIIMIRKFKRRTMLFSITSLGILVMLVTAGYTYAKSKNLMPFDHPYLGVLLIHLHMFTVASCTISLPYIIAGEIFPLKYKGVAGGISILFFSLHFSVVVKTVPYLFNTLGIYGAYCMYAGIVAYCLLVTVIFLPETKDRTLQDIANDFRCTKLHLKSLESETEILCNT
ncbi:hypothetical protein ACJJTC_007575 [Scirpophaga incertulas]